MASTKNQHILAIRGITDNSVHITDRRGPVDTTTAGTSRKRYLLDCNDAHTLT